MRRGRGGLDDGAVGAEAAAQHRDARARKQRVRPWADDIGIPDRGVVEVIGERGAIDADGRVIEEVANLAQHREQPASAEQVVHQEATGRLEVDEERDVSTEPIEVVQRQVDAEPAGDGEQVQTALVEPPMAASATIAFANAAVS